MEPLPSQEPEDDCNLSPSPKCIKKQAHQQETLNFMLATVLPAASIHVEAPTQTRLRQAYSIRKWGRNLKLGQKEFCVSFMKLIHANEKKSFGYLWT